MFHELGVYRILNELCVSMHKKRKQSLCSVVASLLSGSSLSLTSLGRHIRNKTTPRHNIKKVDRLLGNNKLHMELPMIYKNQMDNVLQWLIPNEDLPLLVDVCFLKGHGTVQTLRASTPISGRSITIYEEVYPKGELRDRQSIFLKRLKDILPPERRVIFICDAGFYSDWYRLIEQHGWDWVGRIRTGHSVNIDGCWYAVKDLMKEIEVGKTYDWPDALLDKQSEHECRLVATRRKPKGRTNLNTYGKKVRHRTSTVYSTAYKEPWILATSLNSSELSRAQVIKAYEKRMCIEESFRDMKSHHFGFGGSSSNSKCSKRWAVLLLIANIASFIAILVGKYARKKELDKNMHAVSLKNKKVYSDNYLGLFILWRSPECKIITDAWNCCHQLEWGVL